MAAGPAVDGEDLLAGVLGDGREHLGDLDGELAGGHEHEAEGLGGTGRLLDAGEHRHAEGERLAGPGAGPPAHVPPGHGDGDRLDLDLERLGEAGRGEAVVDARRHAELGEAGRRLDGGEDGDGGEVGGRQGAGAVRVRAARPAPLAGTPPPGCCFGHGGGQGTGPGVAARGSRRGSGTWPSRRIGIGTVAGRAPSIAVTRDEGAGGQVTRSDAIGPEADDIADLARVRRGDRAAYDALFARHVGRGATAWRARCCAIRSPPRTPCPRPSPRRTPRSATGADPSTASTPTCCAAFGTSASARGAASLASRRASSRRPRPPPTASTSDSTSTSCAPRSGACPAGCGSCSGARRWRGARTPRSPSSSRRPPGGGGVGRAGAAPTRRRLPPGTRRLGVGDGVRGRPARPRRRGPGHRQRRDDGGHRGAPRRMPAVPSRPRRARRHQRAVADGAAGRRAARRSGVSGRSPSAPASRRSSPITTGGLVPVAGVLTLSLAVVAAEPVAADDAEARSASPRSSRSRPARRRRWSSASRPTTPVRIGSAPPARDGGDQGPPRRRPGPGGDDHADPLLGTAGAVVANRRRRPTARRPPPRRRRTSAPATGLPTGASTTCWRRVVDDVVGPVVETVVEADVVAPVDRRRRARRRRGRRARRGRCRRARRRTTSWSPSSTRSSEPVVRRRRRGRRARRRRRRRAVVDAASSAPIVDVVDGAGRDGARPVRHAAALAGRLRPRRRRRRDLSAPTVS